MREFFDTSVLVAAFWAGHVHHGASIRLLASAHKKHSACGVHSLADLYASMSALPVKPVIPPEHVLLFTQEVRTRLALIALDEDEVFATLEKAAGAGVAGGKVYDALLLRCAEKCGAQSIYTWNLRHFQRIAPNLAERIRTP